MSANEPTNRKRKAEQVSSKSAKKSSEWNFAVDYNDHFETPHIAYSDLLPMLIETAKSLNKNLSDLVIYDPYWCQGSMVLYLKSLGCNNVINLNRDFYKDISINKIPGTYLHYLVLCKLYKLIFHIFSSRLRHSCH